MDSSRGAARSPAAFSYACVDVPLAPPNTRNKTAISCVLLAQLLKAGDWLVEPTSGTGRIGPEMSRKYAKQRVMRIVSVLALIGLLLAPRDFVLCVADSGHVAIESATELSPCQPVSDDSRFPSQPNESCDDTPLVSKVVKLSGSLEIVALVASVAAPSPRLAADTRPAPIAEITQPTPPSWLRYHRTIVLLV